MSIYLSSSMFYRCMVGPPLKKSWSREEHQNLARRAPLAPLLLTRSHLYTSHLHAPYFYLHAPLLARSPYLHAPTTYTLPLSRFLLARLTRLRDSYYERKYKPGSQEGQVW